MATTLGFKDLIDLPEWRPMAPSPIIQAGADYIVGDLRNSVDACPYFWSVSAQSQINVYNKFNDGWVSLVVLPGGGFGGSVLSGLFGVFAPSHGPSGTVGGTPSTTGFTLAALPNSASVGLNQLANQGNGRGFKIRVKDNGAGGTGKTEETYIVANTSGATPVVTLLPALTFTPVANSTYEILSGRLYHLGAGATAAGSWKAFDVATQSLSGNLSTTNLPATIGTRTVGLVLDELYVPYNVNPGDGFIAGGSTYNNGASNAILATAADGTHITGSGMPATLLTNEFVNFQVRIVEDATTPTSVGQRRKISAHGSGAAAQFTVATWGVTPSATAKFVVEGNNDLLLWTAGNTATYSYAAGGFAADASWSSTAYAGPGTAYGNSGQMIMPSLFIVRDSAGNVRNSHILSFRGASSNTLDQFDISNGATGTWTLATNYLGRPNLTTTAITDPSSGVPDPSTNSGRYFYLSFSTNVSVGTQCFGRFDVLNRVLEPWTFLRFTMVSGSQSSQLLAVGTFIDGSTKLSFLYYWRYAATELFNIALQR